MPTTTPAGRKIAPTAAALSPALLARRTRDGTALPRGRTSQAPWRLSNKAVGWMMSTVTTGKHNKERTLKSSCLIASHCLIFAESDSDWEYLPPEDHGQSSNDGAPAHTGSALVQIYYVKDAAC